MASEAETLQIILEAVANMSDAVAATTAGLGDIEKAIEDLDGKTAKPEVDISSLTAAVDACREVAEAIRDVDGAGGGAPAKGFFDGLMSALSPTKLLSDALGVFGGNILTGVVSSIASVLNPLTLLSGAFDLVTGAVGTVSDLISGGFSLAFSAAEAVVSGIGTALSGIATVAGGVLDFFGGLASGAMAVVTSLGSIVDVAVSVGSALVSMGQTAVGAIADLTNTSAAFNEAILTVGASTGSTAEAMASMSAEALKIGNTTSTSAQDAAEGLVALQKAGFGAEGSMKALGEVVNLVEATGADMGTAVGQVSQTLKQFGLNADDAGRVVNLFAAGAKAGIGNVTDAMGAFGTVAGAFNVKLEEAYGALGVLSKAGVDTSASAAALKLGMLNLVSPTKQVAETLSAAGVNVDSLNPKTSSLAEIIDTLGKAALTDAQYLDVFGNRAGPVMKTLVDQGSGALKALTAEITGTTAAADLASARDALLAESLENLEARWSNLSIILGTVFEPAVKAIVDALVTAVSGINDFLTQGDLMATTSAALGEAGKAVADAIAGIATVIPGVLTSLAGFITAAAKGAAEILKISGGFAALGTSASPVGTILGNLVTALSAVGAGVASFVSSLLPAADEFDRLALWVTKCIAAFGEFAGAALDLGGSVLGAILPALLDVGASFANVVRNVIEAGTAVVSMVVEWNAATGATATLGKALSDLGGWIGTLLDAFLAATVGTQGFDDMLVKIATSVAAFIARVTDVTVEVVAMIDAWARSDEAMQTVDAAAQFTMTAFGALVDIVSSVIDAVTVGAGEIIKFAGDLIASGTAGGTLVEIFFQLSEAAKGIAGVVVEAAAGFVEWVTNADNLNNAFSIAVAAVQTFIDVGAGIITFATGAISALASLVEQIVDYGGALSQGLEIDWSEAFLQALGIAEDLLADYGPKLLDTLAAALGDGTTIGKAIDGIIGTIEVALVDGIKAIGSGGGVASSFASIWESLATISDATTAALEQLVVSVFDALVDLFTANAASYGAQIGEAIAGIASSVGDAAKTIVDALAEGMGGGGGENPIVVFFSAMIDEAGPAIEEAFGALAELVQTALATVLDGLGSIVGVEGLGSKIIDPMIEAIKAGDWGLLAGQVTDLVATAIGDGLAAVGGMIVSGINELFGTDFQASMTEALGIGLVALGGIIAAAPAVIAAVTGLLAAIGAAFAAVFTAPAIGAALAAIGIGVLIADALGLDFTAGFSSFGEAAEAAITATFDAVVTVLSAAVDLLILPFTTAVAAISSAASGISTAVSAIGAALSGASSTISGAATTIGGSFSGVWAGISAEISALLAGLTQFATDAAAALAGIVAAFVAFPADLVASGAEIAGTVAAWLEENVLGPVVAFGESILAEIEALGPTVAEGVTGIFSFMLDLPAQALEWGSSIIDSFISGVTNTIESGKQMISDAAASVFAIFESNSPPKEGPLKNIANWGANLAETYTASYVNGLSSHAGDIMLAGKGMSTAITEGSAPATAAAAEIPKKIAAGFTAGSESIAAAGAGIGAKVSAAILPAAGQAATAGAEIGKGLANGVASGAANAAASADSLGKVVKEKIAKIPEDILPTSNQFFVAIEKVLARGLKDPEKEAAAMASALGKTAADQLAKAVQTGADTSKFDSQAFWSNMSAAFGKANIDPREMFKLDLWTDSGNGIGEAFMKATVDKLGAKKPDLVAQLSNVFGPLESHSPPKEGPLANINTWGASIASSFVDGMGTGFVDASKTIGASMQPIELSLAAGAGTGALAFGSSFKSAMAASTAEIQAAINGPIAEAAPVATMAAGKVGGSVAEEWAKGAEKSFASAAPKMGTDVAKLIDDAFGKAIDATPLHPPVNVEKDPTVLAGASAAGKALADAYGKGIIEDPTTTKTAVKQMLLNAYGSLEETGGKDYADIRKSGQSIIKAFTDGMASGLGESSAAFKKQLADFIKPLIAHSPPTVGPLMEIDTWGASIGGVFASSLAEGIGAGARALLPEVAKVGATLNGALGDSPVSVAANVAAAEPVRALDGGRPQSVAVTVQTGAVTINTGEDKEKFFAEMAARMNDELRRAGVTGRGRAGQAVRPPI